jgi:hypothetical protein
MTTETNVKWNYYTSIQKINCTSSFGKELFYGVQSLPPSSSSVVRFINFPGTNLGDLLWILSGGMKKNERGFNKSASWILNPTSRRKMSKSECLI